MARPSRTTVRVNGNFFSGMEPPATPRDTIYYVKTETPHLGDFSIFGPFECLEAVVPSIRLKLQETSPAGLNTFDEMMTTGPNALMSFEYVVAPLPDGCTMTIRLLKEQNAELAATLPGPAWVVLCAEPTPSSLASRDEEPKLKDLTICGAFISAEKANQAARQVVADKLQGMRRGRRVEEMKSDGTVQCAAISATQAWLVEVKRESGTEYFHHQPYRNMATQPEPSCSTCHEPQSALVNPLMRCGQCRIAHYCSKECQKSDWKSHKRICALQGVAPPTAQASMP
jgi:hypothetical protein